MIQEIIVTIIISALPVIFAITVHEAAHGYAAKRFGDATAYILGRVTLNPIKHISPVGTILVPLLCILLHLPFVVGQAKPVPVNFGALRNPKRDMIWVAAAGPAANLLMGIFWLVLFMVADKSDLSWLAPLQRMSYVGVYVNITLMFINLFPMLPLDGGRILEGILPKKTAYEYSKIEPYGLIILIVLLASRLLDPFFLFIQDVIYLLTSL